MYVVLDSGSDVPTGRSWFLVGAQETGRVFLVVVRGAQTEVRWLYPHARWMQCEPASAVEAERAVRSIEGHAAGGTLAWDDVERSTAVWRTFRDGGATA